MTKSQWRREAPHSACGGRPNPLGISIFKIRTITLVPEKELMDRRWKSGCRLSRSLCLDFRVDILRRPFRAAIENSAKDSGHVLRTKKPSLMIAGAAGAANAKLMVNLQGMNQGGEG